MLSMKYLPFLFAFLFFMPRMSAQDADPVVAFYDTEEKTNVELRAGDSHGATAPLPIECTANIDAGNYNYIAYWHVTRKTATSTEEIFTRYEDNTSYTLTLSGSYDIELHVTFTLDGDTILYEGEPMVVTISESLLQCPNAFSPNDDQINDVFLIKHKSIIKLDAVFFNRWGQKLYTMNIDNVDKGWDGKVGGKPIKDGVYFVQIKAEGSDGRKYNIKKTISVLKGYNKNAESTGGGGDL